MADLKLPNSAAANKVLGKMVRLLTDVSDLSVYSCIRFNVCARAGCSHVSAVVQTYVEGGKGGLLQARRSGTKAARRAESRLVGSGELCG